MISIKKVLLYVITAGAMINFAAADVIYVPDDFPIIQDAIAAAADGDSIIVRAGTYPGDNDFGGKAIVVISESGADSTIIDPREETRGFIFQSGETAASVVEGFKIINGVSPEYGYGGGIYCLNSSPTIRGNIITDCLAYWGGGIGCVNSSPLIENNYIYGCEGDRGGAIACGQGSQPVIIDNIIDDNYASGG